MNFEEQKLALDTLYYEILMLNESFKQCSYVSVPVERCVVENNILIESFLLHARNLIDFLEDEKFDSDIKCSDFSVKGVKIILSVENNKEKINKFLSHLTKERLTWEKPKWNRGKIRKEINKELTGFLNKIDQNLFPTKEGRAKENFDALLNN